MTELAQSFTIHGQTPEALAKALMDEMREGMVQGKRADHNFMKKLIAAGADLGTTGRYGRNPLQLAAGLKYNLIVDELIKAGTPLDAQDPKGLTALHLAASVCSGQIVKKLLAAGANPGLPDEEGKTPLHHAQSMGANDEAIIAIASAVKIKAETAARAAEAEAAAIKAAIDQYLADGLPLQQNIKVTRQLKLRPAAAITA